MTDWRISDTHQRVADEADADWRDEYGGWTWRQRFMAEHNLTRADVEDERERPGGDDG